MEAAVIRSLRLRRSCLIEKLLELEERKEFLQRVEARLTPGSDGYQFIYRQHFFIRILTRRLKNRIISLSEMIDPSLYQRHDQLRKDLSSILASHANRQEISGSTTETAHDMVVA